MADKDSLVTEASLEEMLSTRLSVDSVTVHGAQRTSPKLLTYVTAPVVSTGGTFSGVVDDVSLAIERLRATGCFRGVDAYLDRSSTATDATVQFTVTEKPLYQLRTGTFVETAGDREATVEGAFLWRNVRGRADTIKMGVNWGGGGKGGMFAEEPSMSWEVAYDAPFVLGLRSRGFAKMGGRVRNWEEGSGYMLRIKEGELGVELPIGRVSIATAWREMVAGDGGSVLVREEGGHSCKTSLKHELEWEGRDSAPMPTEGLYFGIREEVTVPRIGDVGFMKGEGEMQLHLPVGASGLSLALGVRAGMAVGKGGKRVLVQDRFFLGGSNSLRGFQSRGVGPRDGGYAVGGEAYYAVTGMVSVPVPHSSLLWQLFNARVHAFGTVGDLTEAAVVGRNVRRLIKKEVSSGLGDHVKGIWKDMYSSMRVAAGLGVALETSLGRVEVNFCHVVRSADSDSGKRGIQIGVSESFS